MLFSIFFSNCSHRGNKLRGRGFHCCSTVEEITRILWNPMIRYSVQEPVTGLYHELYESASHRLFPNYLRPVLILLYRPCCVFQNSMFPSRFLGYSFVAFLGAFAELRRASVSFVSFVYLCLHAKTRLPLEGFSCKFICEFLLKMCRKKYKFFFFN
jgi:hypothetical protein